MIIVQKVDRGASPDGGVTMVLLGRVVLAAVLGLAALTGASAAWALPTWDGVSLGANSGGHPSSVGQRYYPEAHHQQPHERQYQLAQYVSPKILRKQAELEERRRRKQGELNERIYNKYGYVPRQRYYEDRRPRYYERPPRYYEPPPRYYGRPPQYYEAPPRYGW